LVKTVLVKENYLCFALKLTVLTKIKYDTELMKNMVKIKVSDTFTNKEVFIKCPYSQKIKLP